MLFKVFMSECFREDPDTVGIIEAEDITDALAKLDLDIIESSPWANDLERPQAAEVNGRSGFITIASTDEDGNSGVDVYRVEYQADGIWMFVATEWQQVFR